MINILYIIAIVVLISLPVSSTIHASDQQYVICKDTFGEVVQFKGTGVKQQGNTLLVYNYDDPVVVIHNITCWIEDQQFNLNEEGDEHNTQTKSKEPITKKTIKKEPQ